MSAGQNTGGSVNANNEITRVGVLGAGSWGTTVATLVAKNVSTSIWARNAKLVDEINNKHTNERYLPEARLPKQLKAFNSIEETIQDAALVLMAVPSHGFRSVLEGAKAYIGANVPVISLTKGLEKESNLRATEIIRQILPDHPSGVLTGPNLASEIIAGLAAAAVLAMEDAVIGSRLAKVFQSSRFRIYTNTDVIGCEISGALKNVIALACGMADGVGAGDNTRAAFITRGLAEIKRLGVVMGAKPESFAGLAGMGDLIATCTSAKSRNYYVGKQIGEGQSLTDITSGMHMVAEGLNTTKVMLSLGEEKGIDLPIATQVHSVICGTKTVYQAFFRSLRDNRPGSEDQPG